MWYILLYMYNVNVLYYMYIHVALCRKWVKYVYGAGNP